MEEAWEFAVVSEPSFTDWSARHTRLRYQTVLIAFLFLLVCQYEVESMSVPGFLKFDDVPNKLSIGVGLLGFCLYSALGFSLQHRIERRTLSVDSNDLKSAASRLLGVYNSDDSHFLPSLTKLSNVMGGHGEKLDVDGIRFFIEPEEMQEFLAVIQEMRKDHEYAVSTDYLDSELMKIFPSQGSPYRSFSAVRERINQSHRDLMQYTDSIIQKDSNRMGLGGDVFRKISSKAEKIKGQVNALALMEADVKSDIQKYVSERKVHSELMPYKIPMLAAASFLIFGIATSFFKAEPWKLL